MTRTGSDGDSFDRGCTRQHNARLKEVVKNALQQCSASQHWPMLLVGDRRQAQGVAETAHMHPTAQLDLRLHRTARTRGATVGVISPEAVSADPIAGGDTAWLPR